MEPNLEALLAQSGRTRRRDAFPPDVAAARYKETSRRNARAQGYAHAALQRLHQEEYRSLYLQAVEKVRREAGPMPGDEEE